MSGGVDIDLKCRRSVAQILVATAQLYRRCPLLFAILALAVMGPYLLAVLAITGYGPLRHGHENEGVRWLLLLARTSLVTPLISALHMHAVMAAGRGERPRLVVVARRGIYVLPVVAAADIMSTLGILLGLLALIVPGIVLLVRWAVVAQAAAVEHEGWRDALRSSGRLTESHARHVLAVLLLIPALGVPGHLGASALPLGSSAGVPSVAIGTALETVIASFSALTLALLYFDLRVRASEAPGHAPREYQHVRDLD